MASHNARLGLRLFTVYVVFYAAYVLTSAFAPAAMDVTPLAGVSLAIWSGAGLIVLALVLAGLYGAMAKDSVSEGVDA
ncbi:MAG: DUF485 domain-containing protein [Planctomycetota bacterium]